MEWALIIIFATASLLLIFSFIQSKKAKIIEQREMDMLYISFTQEINKLKKQIQGCNDTNESRNH